MRKTRVLSLTVVVLLVGWFGLIPPKAVADEDQELLKELEGVWIAMSYGNPSGYEVTVRLPDTIEIEVVWVTSAATKQRISLQGYGTRYVGRVRGSRIRGTYKEHLNLTFECRFSGRIVNEDQIILKMQALVSDQNHTTYMGCDPTGFGEITLNRGL